MKKMARIRLCMPKHIQGIWQDANAHKASFTDQLYMTDVYMSYVITRLDCTAQGMAS